MVTFYRPQRSCGQGNIFTLVCHSVHRGGVSSRENPPCQGEPPLPGRIPPGRETPAPRTRQTPPRDQADTPPRTRQTHPPRTRQTPPRKQMPAYGQWAAGTHPSGMHSCFCKLSPRQAIFSGEVAVKYQVQRILYWSVKSSVCPPSTLIPRVSTAMAHWIPELGCLVYSEWYLSSLFVYFYSFFL